MQFEISSGRKTGKEIPESSKLEFLEKFSVKKFFFIRCSRQHLWAIEWRRYIEWFTFVKNTISNSLKVLRAKFLGSDRRFCFSSICKFDSFKNPFAMSTSLTELSSRFRRFATNKKSDFCESSFTWYLQWGIYTSSPTWTHSQNSPAAAEAPSLKISSCGTFLKWLQRIS